MKCSKCTKSGLMIVRIIERDIQIRLMDISPDESIRLKPCKYISIPFITKITSGAVIFGVLLSLDFSEWSFCMWWGIFSNPLNFR